MFWNSPAGTECGPAGYSHFWSMIYSAISAPNRLVMYVRYISNRTIESIAIHISINLKVQPQSIIRIRNTIDDAINYFLWVFEMYLKTHVWQSCRNNISAAAK